MAGGKGKPAKAPAKGKAAPKGAAPAPVQAVTDKFGLALLVIVAVLLIGNLVIWGSVPGVSIFNSGIGQMTVGDYNLKVPQGQLKSYLATGRVGQRPGEVDAVVINRGRLDGVRVGDVFVPSQTDYDTAKYIVEFSVYHVDDASCRAWIITNMDLSLSADNADAVRVVDRVKPESSNVVRNWSDQRVRSKVMAIGS